MTHPEGGCDRTADILAGHLAKTAGDSLDATARLTFVGLFCDGLTEYGESIAASLLARAVTGVLLVPLFTSAFEVAAKMKQMGWLEGQGLATTTFTVHTTQRAAER